MQPTISSVVALIRHHVDAQPAAGHVTTSLFLVSALCGPCVAGLPPGARTARVVLIAVGTEPSIDSQNASPAIVLIQPTGRMPPRGVRK